MPNLDLKMRAPIEIPSGFGNPRYHVSSNLFLNPNFFMQLRAHLGASEPKSFIFNSICLFIGFCFLNFDFSSLPISPSWRPLCLQVTISGKHCSQWWTPNQRNCSLVNLTEGYPEWFWCISRIHIVSFCRVTESHREAAQIAVQIAAQIAAEIDAQIFRVPPKLTPTCSEQWLPKLTPKLF